MYLHNPETFQILKYVVIIQVIFCLRGLCDLVYNFVYLSHTKEAVAPDCGNPCKQLLQLNNVMLITIIRILSVRFQINVHLGFSRIN